MAYQPSSVKISTVETDATKEDMTCTKPLAGAGAGTGSGASGIEVVAVRETRVSEEDLKTATPPTLAAGGGFGAAADTSSMNEELGEARSSVYT
jgi:hypothetical protein